MRFAPKFYSRSSLYDQLKGGDYNISFFWGMLKAPLKFYFFHVMDESKMPITKEKKRKNIELWVSPQLIN
jgi:hypothetical protein